jgi:hypothetical protein
MAAERSRSSRLKELAATIDAHSDWWRFPEDPPVRGFLGLGRFIVGDQPSTSPWDPWHPHRRAFYGLLAKIGAANAHLTDVYKRRGVSGSLKYQIPPDFEEHLRLFRSEVEIIRPKRIVALGELAYHLLVRHASDLRPILRLMWHFSYGVRPGKAIEWEANARSAIWGA